MATILHIESSVRVKRSISKALGSEFIKQWQAKYPQDKVIYRDLGRQPPEFISEAWIEAAFTPCELRADEQKSSIALSDLLIKELSQSDIIVITTPMYNYGMPAHLKAWFDQVIRVNETFSFDLKRGDFPLQPTMSGKALVLLTSCGEFGFGKDGVRREMNHLGPHIRTTGTYLGVEEFYELGIEYQEFGDARHENSIKAAYAAIPELINQVVQKSLKHDYQ